MRVMLKEPENDTVIAVEASEIAFKVDVANECMGIMIVKMAGKTGTCKMPKITYEKYIEDLNSHGCLDLRHRQFVFEA